MNVAEWAEQWGGRARLGWTKDFNVVSISGIAGGVFTGAQRCRLRLSKGMRASVELMRTPRTFLSNVATGGGNHVPVIYLNGVLENRLMLNIQYIEDHKEECGKLNSFG